MIFFFETKTALYLLTSIVFLAAGVIGFGGASLIKTFAYFVLSALFFLLFIWAFRQEKKERDNKDGKTDIQV